MILVSACLLGKNCKYDGGNNKNQKVLEYLRDKQYIAVCPETMGGLKSPRLPAEIQNGRVYLKDGTDVTCFFEKGAETVCQIAEQYNAQEAILKERSPSCGCHFVYDGTFTGGKIPGCGITAQRLVNKGISVKSEEDLEKDTQIC